MKFYVCYDEIGNEISTIHPYKADSLEDVINDIRTTTWYNLRTNVVRITDTHGVILAKVTV